MCVGSHAQEKEETMKENRKAARPEAERKPYRKPAILHELELEVRAGSPLGLPHPGDLLGLGTGE